MASACALEWAPESLYNSAISVIVTHYSKNRRELKTLPENVQFDIYYKLYNKGRLCQLGMEFTELDIFAKVLKVNDKRHLLHHSFQALMDHGVAVSDILAHAYVHEVHRTPADKTVREKAIQLGFALGGFLSDAAWFSAAEKVLQGCLSLCKDSTELPDLSKAMECCVRLLHVQNANCRYEMAQRTLQLAEVLMQRIKDAGHLINKATLHSETSSLLFAKSEYDKAHETCCQALSEISSSTPPKAVVDVLRQASKACVVKRQFKRAEMLIKYAVQYAREQFGRQHHKYSDALLDYGFFLLNIDCVGQAVQVYQASLDIRQSVFGGNNLHVAVAHEDLAYASYVHEYSSGRFSDAKEHAEKAIEIITALLPKDHLLLASSKRVKALILEEIAIDSHDKILEQQMLEEAQDLHLQSLDLAMKAFGENNVQTAKHYGNLGRLYQSMKRFEAAEVMHLKAIAIKEKLLGKEDYEVALSVGHLASLYNYDMHKFSEAEKLYLRSIAIGVKLFGEGYSGLEYDYRGLIRLYNTTGDYDKAQEYGVTLQRWNDIRDRFNAEEKQPLEFEKFSSIEDVVHKFYEIQS